MDAVLRSISRDEALEFLREAAPVAKHVLAATSLFYGGFAGGRLALVAGVVIDTLLDEEAYVWMQGDQTIIDQIPITFARMAKRFIEELPYILIRGHTSPLEEHFIRFLGGHLFEPILGGLIPFEIRKDHG